MTNWPGLAALPALASRAGYARKSIQLPFATGATPPESDAPEIIWGTGSPEGLILGAVGDWYIQTDGTNGRVHWTKAIGSGNATGWYRIHTERSLGIYVPADFGNLVEGGVTDNRATFVATAAAMATAGGGTCLIPPGTFAISGNTVLFPQNSTVRGAGRGLTTIKRIGLSDATSANMGAAFGTGSADGVFYNSGTRGTFAWFSDFSIDGNYAGQTVTSATPHCDGIRADYTDYVVITNVYIKDCFNSGIYLYACRRSRLEGVVAQTNGRLGTASSRNGITITGPTDDATDQGAQDEHQILFCEGIGNTDEGLAFGRVGLVTVTGGIYRDNGDKGIEGDIGAATADTTSVPAGVIIVGVHAFNNTNKGIAVNNGNVQRVVIANCVIETHGKDAINTDFTSGSVLVIEGCVLRNFNTANGLNHGMTIGDFDDVTINANVLSQGGTGGGGGIVFLAAAAARHVSVTGNVVENVNGSAFALNGAITGVVDANFAYGAGTRGFEITASSAALDELIVSNCHALNGAGAGFLIRTTSTFNLSNVRLKGCVAKGNTGQGLLCSQSVGTVTNLYFEDCSFSGNTGASISGLTGAMVAGFRARSAYVTLTDAATILVDAALGDEFEVTLTAARNLGAPSNLVKGQRLLFHVIQDGTGGWNLTPNAVYKNAWSNVGNTAGKRSTLEFVSYDGTNLVQIGAQSAYI